MTATPSEPPRAIGGKPAAWALVAGALSVLNVVAVAFAGAAWHATVHAVLGLAFGVAAVRLRQRLGGAAMTQVQEQLDDQAEALEETQRTLAGQATQLAELHERVDFAERLLAQARQRQALGNPNPDQPR